MIIKTYKPIGMTPLELQNIVREKFKNRKNIKMGFAGRLDPMAHGEMIFLLAKIVKFKILIVVKIRFMNLALYMDLKLILMIFRAFK